MRKAMAVLALAMAAGTASADTAGVNVYGNGTEGWNNYWTLGYYFTPNTNITLTQLGAWDSYGDGFVSGFQEVGLWDVASSTMLAYTQVGNGSALDGGFRWERVSPVALTPGMTYVVGATNHEDTYHYGDPTATVAPQITYIADAYGNGGNYNLEYPLNTSGQGNAFGWYGGNIKFVPAPGAAAFLAFAGIAAARRRR